LAATLKEGQLNGEERLILQEALRYLRARSYFAQYCYEKLSCQSCRPDFEALARDLEDLLESCSSKESTMAQPFSFLRAEVKFCLALCRAHSTVEKLDRLESSCSVLLVQSCFEDLKLKWKEPLPTFYKWLEAAFLQLRDKISLLFDHNPETKNFQELSMRRSIEQFVVKSKAQFAVLLWDSQGVLPRHGPFQVDGKSSPVKGLQGLERWPIVYAYHPEKGDSDEIVKREHGAIVSHIMLCDEALKKGGSPIFYQNPKSLMTYFFSPLDRRLTFAVVFASPGRKESDKLVTDFMASFISRQWVLPARLSYP